MSKVKRTTQVYELKQGHKKVYVGTTNDPERRMKEHERAGKKFTHMNVLTGKKTQSNAKKMEKELIEKYGGSKRKTPKYNKTLWG
ncbi:putative GIY-YIG superfamily endonuclease [Methanococcus maripaludis]|uniref:Putative GIY-YIG superfamily endonuclease n=1 Tax=Methanococcus maripaludis TaxID=39152 RepID=A0A7J9NL58_METMI|nr:GIY-YIG nuclease family protein [Methanococcus maripaludis]MBA2846163.1 putative GIY-YIG superfamily endonuclease [Methanococcus maripaludis]